MEEALAWLREKLRSPVGQIVVFMILQKLVKWLVRRFGPQEKDVPLGNVKRIHSTAEWDMWLKDAADKKQLLIADFTATWCLPA
jgi:thiol:disulfide interchange protein